MESNTAPAKDKSAAKLTVDPKLSATGPQAAITPPPAVVAVNPGAVAVAPADVGPGGHPTLNTKPLFKLLHWLSQLLGKVHHLPLGLLIGQKLSRTRIDPQHADASSTPLPGKVNTTGTDQ